MPPDNASNGSSQQAAARKRSLAGANRVAIPLPLSRPRPAKTQAKPSADAAVEAPVKKAIAQDVEDGREKNAPAVEKVDNVDKGTPTSNTPAAETPVSRGSTAMSVSDGPTPEPKSTRQPTPPLAAAAPPKPAIQAHAARKPSQIRTELPPAFVPSAAQHTPHSSLSMNRNSQVFQPQAHPSRPSASSIVFGGEDSSTSSPAPPQSAGSNFMPPPTFPVQRQPLPFVPTSHAHHFSEPQPYANYPPGYPPPFPGQRPMFAAQPPHFQQHSHANFRYPPREPFVPAEASQPNGHASASRSESPSSANAAQGLRSPTAGDRPSDGQNMMFPEPKAAFPGLPGYRQQQFNRQMPPPQQGSPDFRSELDNAQVLRDHIRTHFASPLLADCHLQITLEADASKQYIDAHKLILARSPTFLALITASPEPSSASLKTQVHIPLKDRNLTLRAFSEALKYLYGGPLLQFSPPQPSQVDGGATNEDRMRHALATIACGVYLRIPDLAIRGVAVATSLTHWDTLPLALSFALTGGLSPVWHPDDGSEDHNSTSSSEEERASPGSRGGPRYDPHATQLLHGVCHFVVTMFPPNFYPATSAPELMACPRLPATPTPAPTSNHANTGRHRTKKLSTSDPRLGGIRFGELPAANDSPARPSQITTTISSLLFSLPFALLKFLLEHPILADRLGAETVGSIMRQTIIEREARRMRCVKARAAAPVESVEGNGGDKNAEVLEGNLGWEEAVEVCAQGRIGLRLARRWRGENTPTSSADGAET